MLAVFVDAQDNWKISLNKKTVLISNKPDELTNIKKIKSIEWKKNGSLEVTYKETTPTIFLHSLQFADESGNPLLVKDSTMTAKISIAVLRKLFAGKKQLKIYLVLNPPNPMMMAPSRMLHLGTLKLP
jgi:beta-lactamase class A